MPGSRTPVGMSAPTTAPERRSGYYHRRKLSPVELMPAVGIGITVGLIAFYLARVLLEREPLLPGIPGPPAARRRPVPLP